MKNQTKYNQTKNTIKLFYIRNWFEKINQTLLDSFYRIKINEDENFYTEFFKILKQIKNEFGII